MDCSDTDQKLWTPALIAALPKVKRGFFRGGLRNMEPRKCGGLVPHKEVSLVLPCESQKMIFLAIPQEFHAHTGHRWDEFLSS